MLDDAYNELPKVVMDDLNTFHKPLTGLKSLEKPSGISQKNGGVMNRGMPGSC